MHQFTKVPSGRFLETQNQAVSASQEYQEIFKLRVHSANLREVMVVTSLYVS